MGSTLDLSCVAGIPTEASGGKQSGNDFFWTGAAEATEVCCAGNAALRQLNSPPELPHGGQGRKQRWDSIHDVSIPSGGLPCCVTMPNPETSFVLITLEYISSIQYLILSRSFSE